MGVQMDTKKLNLLFSGQFLAHGPWGRAGGCFGMPPPFGRTFRAPTRQGKWLALSFLKPWINIDYSRLFSSQYFTVYILSSQVMTPSTPSPTSNLSFIFAFFTPKSTAQAVSLPNEAQQASLNVPSPPWPSTRKIKWPVLRR